MNRKLKITYVLGMAIRWIAHETLATHMKEHDKFEVDFIILDASDPLQYFLKEKEIPYRLMPLVDYANTPELVKSIYDHLKANQTDIVHTVFFNGHITGMQAAYYANVPVRVFSRQHGGVQYKRHAKSQYELIWEMATNAISVTQKGVAGMIADGIAAEKITAIPDGFEQKKYENISATRIEHIREKYNIPKKAPIIGIVARHIAWKGVKYAVDAFKEILKIYPDAFLIMAGSHKHIIAQKEKEQKKASKGIHSGGNKIADFQEIEERLQALPKSSFIEISFESDVMALYKLFDVFVHVPINKDVEAFGLVYLDSMLAKVPSVITRSGIAYDFAVHKEHAWIVDYENTPQIVTGIQAILDDKKLRNHIVKNAFEVASTYTVERRIKSLEKLYIDTYTKVTHQKSNQVTESMEIVA